MANSAAPASDLLHPAVGGTFSGLAEAASVRSAMDAVLPDSLAQSAMFATPIGQRAMRLSGRGRSSETGTVYSGTKVGRVADGRWALVTRVGGCGWGGVGGCSTGLVWDGQRAPRQHQRMNIPVSNVRGPCKATLHSVSAVHRALDVQHTAALALPVNLTVNIAGRIVRGPSCTPRTPRIQTS